MKLSIVITAYRCERYLGDCLSSVTAQRGDVEVIVVRDVLPVGRARNEGLGQATGDYVWFVDGDDLVAPWAAEALGAAVADVTVRESVPDIVMFGYERFPDGTAPMFDRTQATSTTFDLDRKEDAVTARQLAIDGLVACSAWYRREAFADCRFGRYKNCEDTLWGLSCFFKAHNMMYVDVRPYGYRDRVGSASKRRGVGRLMDVCGAMCGVVASVACSRHASWHFFRLFRYALGMVYRTAFSRRR